LTTKTHAVVDALGNPLAIRLTGGQAHDIPQAEALLAHCDIAFNSRRSRARRADRIGWPLTVRS